MLKKTVLTFAFLTIFTTFYGFNNHTAGPAANNDTATVEALAENDFSLLAEGQYAISAYDNIIRNVSRSEGNDWRLMSAIAYHESRFQPGLTSPQGARGLMQIMPSVARHFKVGKESIAEPRVNVWLANKLLSEIERSMQIPSSAPKKDRMSLVLASYNSGVGHVADARRLAKAHGENPNSWEVVARYMELKAQPEYYQRDVVKCGQFKGIRQTRAYVKDVIGRYDKYCRIAAR